jgi:drug/metabolite transporter (DMT)-like permease
MSPRLSGYLLVAGGSALFASTGVVSAVAFDGGVAPIELAAMRSYVAALLLLPFLALAVRLVRRADLVPIALFALVGIVLAQGFYYGAISRMDIAVALVIVYTGPLLVAAYQRVFHAERLPLLGYLAMVLAVTGVAIAVLGGAGGIGGISLLGVGFALLTAVCFAGQAILGARQPTSLPPLARTGAGMLAAAVIWIPLVPVWALPVDGFGDPATFTGRFELEIPVGAAVLYAAVFGSVVPYALLIMGLMRIGPGAGSMAGMTEPIVAPMLAWFALGQLLTPLQIVGVGLTIACVAIVERQRYRLRRVPESYVAEL